MLLTVLHHSEALPHWRWDSAARALRVGAVLSASSRQRRRWSRARNHHALVELLISTVHRIDARAEKKVVKEFVKDFRRVTGKDTLLRHIAKAALDDVLAVLAFLRS